MRSLNVSAHPHGLWPKGGGDKERLRRADRAPDDGGSLGAPLDDLELEARVLLRADSFAVGAVVVHTWLAVLRAVDGVPLAELDLAQLVELFRLPADEGVVVRVRVRRDERAAPVYPRAEELVVFLRFCARSVRA